MKERGEKTRRRRTREALLSQEALGVQLSFEAFSLAHAECETRRVPAGYRDLGFAGVDGPRGIPSYRLRCDNHERESDWVIGNCESDTELKRSRVVSGKIALKNT